MSSPAEEGVLWFRGQPYVMQWLVTSDGRFVYVHQDTRRPYAHVPSEEGWCLAPLAEDEDVFDFLAWMEILKLTRP